MRFGYFIISIVLSVVVVPRALSKTIELFDKNGHPTEDYNKIKIEPGDVLKFNDGLSYEVISHLGEGKVNTIFKVRMTPPRKGIPDPLALRLPISSSGRQGKLSPQDYINQYIDGYKSLEANQIPIPRKFRSLDGQYVASEFIDKDFDGHQFFTDPEGLAKKYSPEVVQEAEEALVRFARMTIRFEEIGDIGSNQLAYNIKTKKWILLDWDNSHKLAKIRLNKKKNHTFEEKFKADLVLVEDKPNEPRLLTPREDRILDRLRLAIIAERRNLLFYRCAIGKLFSH